MSIKKSLLCVMLFLCPSLCLADAQTLTPEQSTLAALQKQIDDAIASHAQQLVIAPGTYRVAPLTAQSSFLNINKANNLTIIAKDILLICTAINRAVNIEDCNNLTLDGLSVDYDPLPFTQAVVIGMPDDRHTMDVKLCDGYPPIDLDLKLVCSVIDPKLQIIKPNTWSRYGGVFEQIGDPDDRTYRIDQRRPIVDDLVIGDYVVLNRKSGVPHSIYLNNSSHCTLRNVTLLASATFGFMESSCSGNHYDHLVIKPGPMPAGATVPRFFSSSADGFHSKHAKVGPLVENCHFEKMGDDGIAINGDFLLVKEVDTNITQPSVTVVVKRGDLYAQVGDRILGLKRETGVPMGQAIVVKTEKLNLDPDEIAKVRQTYLKKLNRKDVFVSAVFRLTLDKPLDIEAGDVLSCPDRNGSGFIVRNNYVGYNRARGLLIKASDGLIENNTIERSFKSGIVLSPELDSWMESDFSRNVIIRNNHVTEVNRGIANPGYFFAGAICITGSGPMPAGGQRNITLEGNTIEKTKGPAIQIHSGHDILIRNNTIVQPHLFPDADGLRFDIPPSAVIFVAQSEKVVLQGNTVQSPGPHMGKMLQTGKDAEVFANEGLRLVDR